MSQTFIHPIGLDFQGVDIPRFNVQELEVLEG